MEWLKRGNKPKYNLGTLMALCIMLVLINIVFLLPMDFLYKIFILVPLILLANPIFSLIESITGAIGQKHINTFVFWGTTVGLIFIVTFIRG